jgi:hypothetical protein
VRSPQEIAFRLRQEGGNLFRLIHPPHVSSALQAPLALLPGPAAVVERLKGTPAAAEIVRLAQNILAHRFPLMGYEIETGPEIDWRRDYISGKSTGVDYFRGIPYLDFERAGDHKIIWEINRHQHLVLLAQAWQLTGAPEFTREIESQLQSWWGANPYGYGINWASALEVAFRAFSWIWAFHLAGDAMSQSFRRRFLESLYTHGRHLAGNLSVYFSPNTHLLGEVVALNAIGALFPDFPRAARWRREAGEMVRAQMKTQVQADGSHFERSSYYHVYALDMLLFPAAIEKMPPDYLDGLARMAEYLDALLGPQRRLPFFGDDDGGRLFHPYGPRDRFGCASIAALHGAGESYAQIGAWWLAGRALAPPAQPTLTSRGSRFFENVGIAIMESGDMQLIADAGPFGAGSGGHSHSDTLSFVLRLGDEDLLIDAGTYTYVAEPHWRNWFRGSAAHNTVRIDGLDQAAPAGPFRWTDKPDVQVIAWDTNHECDFLAAICRYRGFEHLRRIQFVKPSLIVVVDDITGPPGEHLVEQFWHSGEPVTEAWPRRFRLGRIARLRLSHDAETSTGGEHGWRSRAFGSKEPAAVICVATRGAFPMRLTACIDLNGDADPAAISAAFQQLGVEPGGAFG